MKMARKRIPFEVHEVTQEEVKSFGAHLLPFFKKSVKSGRKSLHIQHSRVLEYSRSHPQQVWVKYGNNEEEWTKFKKNAKELTLPSGQKYAKPLPVKPAKLKDVKVLVEKYVPPEFHSFYTKFMGNEEASSETEESETD